MAFVSIVAQFAVDTAAHQAVALERKARKGLDTIGIPGLGVSWFVVRFHSRRNTMRFLLAIALGFAAVAAYGDTTIYARRVTISSAQDDADEMARTGILRHCGRNAGRREGIGTGPTPDTALRNCCYYGRYRIVEKGVAYSPSRRQWFAVIRYE